MLRAHARFEHDNPMFGGPNPPARDYHVVEQTLELPLWKVRVLPKPGVDDDPGNARLWRSFVSCSAYGVLQVVSAPDWEQVSIHVVLPGYMGKAGELQLARCTAIWGACRVDDPQHQGWVFETDRGIFVEPDTRLSSLDEMRKEMLVWEAPILQVAEGH